MAIAGQDNAGRKARLKLVKTFPKIFPREIRPSLTGAHNRAQKT